MTYHSYFGRFLASLALTLLGCGTDAVGVDACRRIESARCEAALPCGDVESVAECQRFAQDNCLHGLALSDEPTNVEVSECVEALQLAGSCAAKRDPDYPPESCSAKQFKDSNASKICQIVREPERTPQCGFLTPDKEDEPDLDDDDAGDAGN